MRKYVSTTEWRDNTDMHLYHEGEPFPFDGREIDAERLEALESGRNRAGLRLIAPCEVKVEREEAQTEEAPEHAVKGRETAPAKTRKKAK